MSRRKLVETYYIDINNLADLLGKLVASYRALIGGADELNKIALAKKKEVKEALNRADELGEVIDELILALGKASYNYVDYCNLKAEAIKCKLNNEGIETEIDDDLRCEGPKS